MPGIDLTIAEGSIQVGLKPSARLSNAHYCAVYTGFRRPLATRFSKIFWSLYFLVPIPSLFQLLYTYLRFKPDVVITVSHGVIWFAAYLLSRITKIPLVLICHDDIIQFNGSHRLFRGLVYRRFKQMYIHSLQVFPICDSMEEGYRKHFGKKGVPLYPTRSPSSVIKTSEEVMSRNKAFDYTIGFAGSIVTQEYAQMLSSLSIVLSRLGGNLFIYGPHTHESLSRMGLSNTNVVCKGLLEPNDLIKDMHSLLDALYVPISFNNKTNSAEYAFPSKLADYTCTSLPIIIQAPLHSSSAKWASLHHSAIVVNSLNPNRLNDALVELSSIDVYQRYSLSAFEAGMNSFQHQSQAQTVFQVLQNAGSILT